MNNKHHIILPVAAAWLAQPSYANQKITSTWTRNVGHNSGPNSLEQSLHAKLKGRVYGHDRDLMADEQTFVGPGVMECSNAVCTFEVDDGLGCTDPCHTRYAPRMYEYPFSSFSTAGDPYYHPEDEEELCFYRNATDINTWSPELAQIEEGCTARCTGCTFASPIVSISGPSVLQCNDGRCTKYIHGETFDCGTALETASEAYGSLATLGEGEDVAHVFYGFEGINGSIEIPETCNLECTGCTSEPIDSGTTTSTEATITTSAAPDTTTETPTTETESTSSTVAAATSQSPTTLDGKGITCPEGTCPNPNNYGMCESKVECFADPCEVNPCTSGVCEANYCGGCHAICVDESRFGQTSNGDSYLRGGKRHGKAYR
jgi:hypothetical protein